MVTRNWFYSINGQRAGPISENDLVQLFLTGELSSNTMVWTDEFPDWVLASTVDGLVPSGTGGNSMQFPEISSGYVSSYRYAGFWKRFLATFLDGIILGILGIVLSRILSIAITGGKTGAEYLELIIRILVVWLYYALLEISSKQATLGKMAVGIIVTDLNGERLSFGRATGRHFGKWISTLPLMFGYLMAAFTSRKQALHDML